MRNITTFILFLLTFNSVAQVSVGWDGACDYDVSLNSNALQQAIDDGAAEIRLSNAQSHNTAIVITNDLVLKGGYSDCTEANAGHQININSVIDAIGLMAPAIIVRQISDASITFDSITVTNGEGFNDGSSFNWGGGVSIDDISGTVNLNNVNLNSNTGYNGGGLSVVAWDMTGNLTLNVNNFASQNNTVTNQGGGIHCYAAESGFNLVMNMTSATVRDNHADNNGGGFYADNCDINFEAGESSFVNSNIDDEIIRNTSNLSGGGIFSVRASVINLNGTYSQSFDIFLNESNLNTSVSAAGGGIMASDTDTIVNIVNGIVTNNSTGRYGGGLYSGFSAQINMSRLASGCGYSQFCSQLGYNTNSGLFPGGGGAVALRFAGVANIQNTLIEQNNSNYNGYVAYLETNNSTLNIEGNIIRNNGLDSSYDNFTGFYSNTDSNMTGAYNTILNNSPSSVVFNQSQSTSTLNLFGNIIKEFGDIHSAAASATTNIDCNLINDISSISVSTQNTIVGTVQFKDSGSSDYRLAETDTIAIDVCSDSNYTPGNDFQNRPRGVDNPNVADVLGLYDLGVFEYDDNDLIFLSTFEM